jgi:S1-C subfamily serine protease
MAREERRMFNKVIIGVLVLALVLAGASGAYAFYLGEQLVASQEQQAGEISALRAEMSAAGEETLARIDALDDELKGVAVGMEQSAINAGQLYEEVSQSIVMISDGESVLGSGFVFDEVGHVLTNQHVVEGQDLIYIISADGYTTPAIIMGSCEYSDVAVLRQNLATPAFLSIPALTLADSTTVKVGEPVIVIGNSLNLPGTLTSGIVSQTNRIVEVTYESGSRGVANVIQFDAAINFGNSGSPLFNAKGEVIGMVTARIDPLAGDGIYYAISANKASRVASSLIEEGSFDYPWLGIEIANLTPKEAIAENLETVNGLMVKTVMPASPAASAGVTVGDIIVAIDGIPVRDLGELVSYLGEYASYGDKVTLTVRRYGAEIELTLTVGKRVD